jgi:HK97 family phage portal protein
VYACVRVLAEAVGSLTLRTYRRETKGRAESFEDPIWRMLALAPNDEMSAPVMWEQVAGCMALCGNSYIEILRNKSRQPFQLYPLHPLNTEPVRLPDGHLAYRTKDHTTGGQRIIAATDILHFRLFSWDGLKGLSPIQQARQTIGWSTAALKQSSRFFGRHSTPPGILTPVTQVNEEDLVNMRQAWELANGGENQGRTAVLPSDWKYTSLGISQRDSQWIESMEFTRQDIAALFRVPPHLIGDPSRLTNASAEQQNLSLVIDTLRPYLVKIEAEIAIKLFDGDTSPFVQFDVSERLRGDCKTRMDAFAVGRQWGILRADDCREQLGMNPLGGPEGAITWAPVNMQDAARLLTTESIQDQPLDGAPGMPPQTRSMFAGYCSSLLSVYKDAIGRVTTRSRRDLETLSPILAPVIQSMVELVEVEARNQFHLDNSWHVSDKTGREYLKSAATRAADWKVEDKNAVATSEFGKAIRSIYYAMLPVLQGDGDCEC